METAFIILNVSLVQCQQRCSNRAAPHSVKTLRLQTAVKNVEKQRLFVIFNRPPLVTPPVTVVRLYEIRKQALTITIVARYNLFQTKAAA